MKTKKLVLFSIIAFAISICLVSCRKQEITVTPNTSKTSLDTTKIVNPTVTEFTEQNKDTIAIAVGKVFNLKLSPISGYVWDEYPCGIEGGISVKPVKNVGGYYVYECTALTKGVAGIQTSAKALGSNNSIYPFKLNLKIL